MGAGPAGLTAAYELSNSGIPSIVLESDNVVGGIARTANYKGYFFDMGGHRFFTKVRAVEEMWKEVLGDDFITRPRASRIYYRGKFFQYPLEPMNALFGLGVSEAIRCGFSYLRAQCFKSSPEEDFETWVSNRFGRRLFQIFFKTYTEKVWGIPCREIKAEWAAQRIKDLSLFTLVWNAIKPRRAGNSNDKVIKTLIHEFQYPRKGPGMMWEKTRGIIERRGSKVLMETPVEKIQWRAGAIEAVSSGGRTFHADHFISSLPIRELIRSFDPAPPPHVQRAAGDFHYRDFLTIALIVRGKNLFPDNWIYVHDSKVKVGRIQNYNNWSPDMVPDPDTTCLGLEYFCSEGDPVWSMQDSALIDLGRRELDALGLVNAGSVIDGTVVRVRKAYPVYDDSYGRGLIAVREFLRSVPNLQLVGRNGMHRYNNQDHSMLTAMLAARNIMGANYDLWKINVDADYHEAGAAITESDLRQLESAQPMTPARLESAAGD
jgi:protoporphyrinogen oxidase